MLTPLIKDKEMLVVVPSKGEGYCCRGRLMTAPDLLALYDDDTEDFIRFDPFYQHAISLREEVAACFLERFDGLNPEQDKVPPFVYASDCWTDYLKKCAK